MIQFEVNEKIYEMPEGLNEVTLGQFIEFKERIDPIRPESLKTLDMIQDKKEREDFIAGLDKSEITDNWFNYYLQYVKYWTNLEDDIIGSIIPDQIIHLYNTIYSLLQVSFDENRTSFKFKGHTYHYPESPEHLVTKAKLYMKGNRTIDFITAMQYEKYADKFGGSDWSVYPYIIATICKKKGEQLPLEVNKRDEWLAARAEVFRDLKLDEAFNVAFFLLRRKLELKDCTNLYSLMITLQHQLQQTTEK